MKTLPNVPLTRSEGGRVLRVPGAPPGGHRHMIKHLENAPPPHPRNNIALVFNNNSIATHSSTPTVQLFCTIEVDTNTTGLAG